MNTKITGLFEAHAQQEEAMERLVAVRDYLSERAYAAQTSDQDPISKRDADLRMQLAVWYSTLSEAMHAIDPRYDETPGPRTPFLRLVDNDG